MLLVFTSDELERLAGNFSAKKPSIEFLGDNQLKVKISKVSIKLSLEEVQPRRLTFSYKMNAVVNFFADRFVSLNKPGIIWDKESDRIHIDFDRMHQEEKLKNFFLRQLIIDNQKMIVEFDLYQKVEDKA
jgi:hypothetical protein